MANKNFNRFYRISDCLSKFFFNYSAIIVFIFLMAGIGVCFINILVGFGAIASSLVLTFTALKYRLDHRNYHKSLFEKRYEIFSNFNEVLWSWAQGKKVTKDMEALISNNTIMRGYYLFSKKTHNFLKEFRQAIINVRAYDFPPENDSSEEWKKRRDESKAFLGKLVDGENLLDCFPELKMDPLKPNDEIIVF